MKKYIEIGFLLIYLFNLLFFRVLVSDYAFESILPTWLLISLGYFLFSGFLFKAEPHFKFQQIASFTYGIFMCFLVLMVFIKLSIPQGPQNMPFIIVSLVILSFVAMLTLLIKFRTPSPNQYLKNIQIRIIVILVFVIPILFSTKKIQANIFYNKDSFLYKAAQIQISLAQSEEIINKSDDYKTATHILSRTLEKYSSLKEEPFYQMALAKLGYNTYMNEEFEKADSILNSVVKEKHIDNETYTDALYYSGLLHSTRENYKKSDSIFAKFLKFNSTPSQFIQYQISFISANNAKGEGLYEKADSIYKYIRSLNNYKEIVGLNLYTKTIAQHADNYYLMNDFTNAIVEYENLLEFIRVENPGTYIESLILSDFARLYLTMGNYTKALSLSNQSIARNVDKFYVPYFHAISIKASTLMSLSKYKEAELLLNEANDMIDTDNVTTEEYSVPIYNALFDLLITFEKFDKAAVFLNSSSNIMLNKYGPSNLNLASTYFRIGEIQYQYKNFDNASWNYNYGFNIYKKQGSSNTLNYLILINNYARIGIEKGDYKEVQRLLNFVESKMSDYIGINHADYAIVLVNLGINELKNGDKEKAKEYLEKAKIIIQKTLGIKSIKYADILVALSQLDKPMAKEYKLQALEIYRGILPPEHSKINDLTK